MILVFPVAKLWADTTPIHIRECTVQLLPWRTFHLFQRSLLFMTLILSQEDYRSSWFHLRWVGIQLYVVFCTGWLSMLALYSCTGGGSNRSLVPRKNVSPSEESGSHCVVVGKSLSSVVYSERSPLIVSGPFQRFQALIHPERHSRKTDHQSTPGEELTQQEEKAAEKLLHLENETAEAIPNPWHVDPPVQQPLDEEHNGHLAFQEAVEEASPPSSQKNPGPEPADLAESDLQQGSDEQLPVPDEQLPVPDEQLPVSDEQLPVPDEQLPGPDDVDPDTNELNVE